MLSLVLLSLAYAALTACGTKGPLYIPEQRYPQKESTQETPEPSDPAPQINPDITAPVEY